MAPNIHAGASVCSTCGFFSEFWVMFILYICIYIYTFILNIRIYINIYIIIPNIQIYSFIRICISYVFYSPAWRNTKVDWRTVQQRSTWTHLYFDVYVDTRLHATYSLTPLHANTFMCVNIFISSYILGAALSV